MPKTMYVVCHTSFPEENKTITKLMKDVLSIDVLNGDKIYSSGNEEGYAYNYLETALEHCDVDTDFSDDFLDADDKLVISEKFNIDLMNKPDYDDITKSVSNIIPIYLDSKVAELKTILDSVSISHNGKASLVKYAAYTYYIEADGQILGYETDDPSYEGYNFRQFADDLRRFMTDCFDRIVIAEKDSSNNVINYAFINKDNYVFVEPDELIDLAFNHIYDLL